MSVEESVEPTSVEWMPQVMRTTVLPRAMSAAALRSGSRPERARVGELALNLPELVEPREVLRRADGRHDEGRAQRRLAQLLELHAVARRVELPKIIDDGRPTGELAVVARLEAEHVLRRGHGLRGLRAAARVCARREGEQRRQQGRREECEGQKASRHL